MGYDGTLKFDTKVDSSGFESGVSKISSLAGGAIKTTSAIIGGAATALVGLGTAAVKVGTDFEASMSNVAAISGATGEELDALTAKAQEMGAKTKFSASESADAFSYMAMAGWKTEDMLNGIEGIMNLAAASGEDLATTSDIVTDALTAFGLSAQDSSHFADILAAASSNANTNVGLMGETFKYVAPVAGALGFSAEDTAQAIGLMANAGIKGSQAGTALRSVFTRLAKPTKQSAQAMDDLGISLTTSSGEVKDLNTLLLEMREKFATLTDAEKAEYAALLAGQEGMSGLLAIVNASDADWNKLAGAIDGCTDELTGYSAAEEMAAKQIDNLQGQITILQSALEGFGIKIYQEIDDPLKEVVKAANEMVGQLTSAFDEGGFDGLVVAFGDVLAQIVTEIANAAPQLIEMAASLVTSFVDSILGNGDKFATAGVGLVTSLVNAILSVSGDLWSASVTLFAEFLSGLAENMPSIIETAKEAIGQFGTALVENAPSIASSAFSIISSLYEGIVSSLPEIASAGVDILNKLAEGIQNTLPDLIPVAMEALMNFSGTLRENVGELVDAGLNLIMALAQSLIDNIPVFIETIPTIVTNIAGIINDNAPKLLAAGLELIVQLALGLVQAIPTIVENIPKIIQAVVEVFTAFNWINLGSNIIKWITDGVKNLAKSIPEAMKSIGQTAKDWLSAINWRTLGSDIIDLILIGIKSLMMVIPNTLKSIGSTAVNFFKSINWADVGANLISGLISGITGSLSGLWRVVSNLCGDLLGYIKSFFGINSPSRVFADEVGAWIPPGVGEGMEDTMPRLLKDAREQMGQLSSEMQATVNAEVGDISFDKTGQQSYEQAQAERMRQSNVNVSGQLEGDRPIEVHTNLYLDKRKFAQEITPAVNHEMYKIDSSENNRGRGN